MALAMASPRADAKPLAAMGLEDLEARALEIEQELKRLPLEKMVGGIGSVGFETKLRPEADHAEWVRVDWGQALPIDQIVLLPVIWGIEQGQYTGSGLPAEFRIVAGSHKNPEGTVIATFHEHDGHIPRSAPLVIPCQITASWVRVEAARLSKRVYENLYNMQMSELLVFSGEENVALNQPVESSSVGNEEGDRRARTQLTDGFLPYEMSVPNAESSGAYSSVHDVGTRPTVEFDLGEPTAVNRIHLHAIESGYTFPRDVPTDFGIPMRYSIEGAKRADFSDAVVLADVNRSVTSGVGPLFTHRFPEGRYRYIRLKNNELFEYKGMMGFSEIEIFSHGKNVALGKPTIMTSGLSGRNKSAVNDGLNRFGRIIPLKEWLGELARRHDLEAELPHVREEIQRRYLKQKKHLFIAGWIAAAAIAIGVLGVLAVQILRMRQVQEMRTRFAADLHDELGASLHSIGMLAEMASHELHSPKELSGILGEIQRMIANTAAATRYRIQDQMHLLEHNLPEDMRNLSRRTLADIQWSIAVEGEEHLSNLKPKFLDDIFLFYKECLVNVSRHSQATRVHTCLNASPEKIQIEVTDNGIGLPSGPPPSLQRRARLLGGRVSTAPARDGGTTISLSLRPKR